MVSDASLVRQGLIKAPQPASKRGDAAPADDDDFWDKQGRNGVARQLQSTEDALPGGRPGSMQPAQPHSKGASSMYHRGQYTICMTFLALSQCSMLSHTGMGVAHGPALAVSMSRRTHSTCTLHRECCCLQQRPGMLRGATT